MTRLGLICLVAAIAGCKAGSEPAEPPAAAGGSGFVVIPAADNRIWVFREGSKELDEFRKHGELAKHVTRIGAGPLGMTVKGPDAGTIEAYVAATLRA